LVKLTAIPEGQVRNGGGVRRRRRTVSDLESARPKRTLKRNTVVLRKRNGSHVGSVPAERESASPRGYAVAVANELPNQQGDLFTDIPCRQAGVVIEQECERYAGSNQIWSGQPNQALVTEVSAPKLTVVRDQIENSQRKLTLRLRSQRDAPTLGLWIDGDSATIRGATVAGRAVPTNRPLGKWSFGFRYLGAPADGVEVQLELDQRTDDVVLRVADSTDDVSAVPGFSPPNGRVLVKPEVW
jgi:hypothetical protein